MRMERRAKRGGTMTMKKYKRSLAGSFPPVPPRPPAPALLIFAFMMALCITYDLLDITS